MRKEDRSFGLDLKIACIVPTYNGREDLRRLLDSLADQTVSFDLFIVDSSSSDGTGALASERGVDLITIPGSQFNHGGTRQMMVNLHPGYDVYVFITQDAYMEDSDSLARLVSPFSDCKVGAVCGRQLPHLNSTPFSQHARLYNYPSRSCVKVMEDAPRFGIKTPFMSNSFSAYRGDALMEVGGFPDHVILSEDMYVAARMLIAGWKVVYSSDAVCRHSHNYSIREEFLRYFDQGVFHAREKWIRQSFGGVGGEGLRYVRSELRFLGFKRIYLWPEAMLRNAVRLIAYKLGQRENLIPIKIKKRLSMHKRYWASPCAEKR